MCRRGNATIYYAHHAEEQASVAYLSHFILSVILVVLRHVRHSPIIKKSAKLQTSKS
jgi:hypothetical protein